MSTITQSPLDEPECQMEPTMAWRDRAQCNGLTHLFFGPAGERPERRVEREAVARSYCRTCPVKEPCKQWARENHEHGIWGGEDDIERTLAGYAPQSPSRRAVLEAIDLYRERVAAEAEESAAAEALAS